MRILFVNDDGYDSIGLHAVADLFKSEHEICVFAPKRQQSAKSHAIYTHGAFRYEKVSGYDYPVYAVDAHPSDCAKLALAELFVAPDLVISGINRGRNMGSDVMYSGTVGAAFEAAYYNTRGIALSIDNYDPTAADYKKCAEFVKNNIAALVGMKLPPHTILNINFPKTTAIGVKVCKMSDTPSIEEKYIIDGNHECAYTFVRELPCEELSDVYYCKRGYITVTPLKMDVTDAAAIKKIKRTEFVL